ncbi:MAG: PHP domain-containing protein [Deltaproteobacteria bacterium]|nr:PHP domain-containing protein [Deltaproteobacteria bacterium]
MFNYEYVGNLHIHSLHSDGGATTEEIARKAAATGLDFICLNDHAHMADALHLDEEGYYGKLLVMVGLEIGVRYHHYLAYDIHDKPSRHNLNAQETIDWVNSRGGFGFMAHPFEKGMPFTEKSIAYTWNDLSVTGYSGVCIWNFTSRWKERVKTVLHGLFFLAFKTQTLRGPSPETLSFWDQESRNKRVVAVGGSDAHGTVFKWGSLCLTPFSYNYLLHSINIHVLLKNKLSSAFSEAKQEIYEAMRNGRLFVAHENLSSAKGFRFDFLCSDGSDLFMGEEAPFMPGQFVVESPEEGNIRLIKDGVLMEERLGKEAIFSVAEKGVYRVEVYKHLFLFGWRPWIFSNPIYLR